MKKLNAVLFLLALPLIACVFVAALESCQKEVSHSVVNAPSTNSTNFLLSFSKELANASKQNIKYEEQSVTTRRTSSVYDNDLIYVAVKFPENTPQEYVNRLPNITTIEDMARMAHETAAEYELVDATYSGYKVPISREHLHASLEGLIAKSKEYLKGKGMTDADIEEMLEENDADEGCLIIFAWGLSAVEHMQEYEEEKDSLDFSSFIPCTQARAIDLNIENKDVRTLIKCSMRALGVDIIAQLSKSNAKKLTKPIIKRLFKVVLRNAIGYVGAAIAAITFIDCINDNYL